MGVQQLEITEKGKSPRKMTVGYLDVIVIALIAAVLAVAAYDRFFVSKVVVVDLTGYVKQQRELFSKGEIGEAEVSKRLARVQELVKSQPKNVIVLLKDVVLANGREIPIPPGKLRPDTR